MVITLLLGNLQELSKAHYQHYYKRFPKATRVYIDRYQNTQQRHQSILSRAILYENGIDLEAIAYNAYKKPFIKGGRFFNISHAHDRVAVAFSDQEIGVDIEYIDRAINLEDFHSVLHANEQKNLTHKRFYHIWTAKEALLKAYGTGFFEDVKAIELLDEQSAHFFSLYRLLTLQYQDDYVLSLAYQKPTRIIIDNFNPKEILWDIFCSLFCLLRLPLAWSR